MGNKNLRFLTDNAPLRATKCSSIYCYTSSNLKQAIANHKPRWENNLQRYNSSCRWSIICLPTSFRFVSFLHFSFRFVVFRSVSFHFVSFRFVSQFSSTPPREKFTIILNYAIRMSSDPGIKISTNQEITMFFHM